MMVSLTEYDQGPWFESFSYRSRFCIFLGTFFCTFFAPFLHLFCNFVIASFSGIPGRPYRGGGSGAGLFELHARYSDRSPLHIDPRLYKSGNILILLTRVPYSYGDGDILPAHVHMGRPNF